MMRRPTQAASAQRLDSTYRSPSAQLRARLLRWLGVPMVIISLAGCRGVGPDYKEPNPPLPVKYYGTGRSLILKPIATQWWQQFRDPKLDALIVQTVNNNNDVATATARLRQARALFTQSFLNLFPVVPANGSYSRIQPSAATTPVAPGANRQYGLWQVGFDANWELDFWGRVRRDVEAQNALVQASEADRRDIIISVMAEVASNYLDLRGTQDRIAVAQSNAQSQLETVNLTKQLRDAGAGTDLDVARAEAQLYTTQATIPSLLVTVAQDMHRISVLVGVIPGTLDAELSKPQPLPRIPDTVGLGLPSQLLLRRPDIRSAERNLAAATANIGVQVANIFPKFTFNGNFSFQALHFDMLTGGAAYSFGPQFSWAALDMGRVIAQIRGAGAQQEQAFAKYESTLLLAFEEIENSLTTFRNSKERRALLGQAVTANETAVRLSQERYRAGAESFLSVLDAERNLFAAQDSYVVSRINTATSVVAIYKALGGGWEAAEIALISPPTLKGPLPATEGGSLDDKEMGTRLPPVIPDAAEKSLLPSQPPVWPNGIPSDPPQPSPAPAGGVRPIPPPKGPVPNPNVPTGSLKNFGPPRDAAPPVTSKYSGISTNPNLAPTAVTPGTPAPAAPPTIAPGAAAPVTPGGVTPAQPAAAPAGGF